MAKKNSNCLQGLECPRCKSPSPLVIAIQASFRFTDEGEDDRVSDLEWDDKSYCECCKCGFNATVGDFKIKQDSADCCKNCELPVLECTCAIPSTHGGNS